MRLPFTPLNSGTGLIVPMPIVPIQLARGSRTFLTEGLVDSGAMVNVLPLDVGLRLGPDWKSQTIDMLLGGVFSGPAKGILLEATIGNYPPVQLAFGWYSSNDVRLVLGQTNFFQQFDVSFHASQDYFEVQPKP
jgi:hypothetical protein